MRPSVLRAVRALLLLVLVATGTTVAWNLRSAPGPAVPPAASPAAPPAPYEPSPLPQSEEVVREGFKGGQVTSVLKAQKVVGQQEGDQILLGVNLQFGFTSRGQRDTATITADDGRVNQEKQEGVFRGNVVVKTAEGFELETNTLHYDGATGLAQTDDMVSFRRKDLSGTARGVAYAANDGNLVLRSEVKIRVQDEGRAPSEIEAGSGVVTREGGTVKLADGVRVVEGADLLTSGKLNVFFAPEDYAIYRTLAVDAVDLRTSGGKPLPGTRTLLGGGSPLHLKADYFDLTFRPDRTLQEAVASPRATLELLPRPQGTGKDAAEKRTLEADVIALRFGEAGVLDEVEARKGVVFTTEPSAGAGAARRVTCRTVLARMDPETGNTRSIDFEKEVVYVQGPRRATANKATYDGTSLLTLREDPVLVDSDQGSELRAATIDVHTLTGDLAARQNVKHLLRRKGAGRRFLSAKEGALVSARFLEYAAATRTVRYREDALLRAGQDEVRGAEITLQEAADGRWRLEAAGGVTSLAAGTGKERRSAAMEARAQSMSYDEARGQLVYRGDAVIRQGDVTTKSPEATLVLAADGGLASLTAGEPVQVEQGTRVAAGRRAVYDPAAEKVEIVGDRVTFKDANQDVEGQSLVFGLKDDRVVVNGQDLRTSTVIKRGPARP